MERPKPGTDRASEAETLPPEPPHEASTLPPGQTAAYRTQGAAAGAEIPGYDILAELGRGGMGVVYKARQRDLPRTVAVKMILAGGHAGEQELARFRTEAEAVARLQHPNIVQVFEVGEASGHPFLALEYCEAGSLADRIDGTPQPPRQAAQLVETLARAVHAAHQKDIVHRDLKPANVLLDAEGRPKITDFGLAKKLDTAAGPTVSGAVMGTPSYMAPEQAAGRGHQVGPGADVYALGAILYELLTGRPPFKAPTALDTMLQVLADEPVPPRRLQPLVPRDLDTICLKCLEKEPRKRYLRAQDLADDLGRFLRFEPIAARPARALYRLGKFARRNKILMGAISAVSFAMLAGVIGISLSLARARAAEREARSAQAEAEHLLEVSHRDAVRLATRRGAWNTVLEITQQALASDPPDANALRLDRVRALCALYRTPQAARELEDLSHRADLGELQPQVLLWQADLEMNRSSAAMESALQQVRQALDRGLPPAEAAYARGLLANNSPEAIEHFREAIRVDPFNPRANGMLALLLICLGRREEARDQLRLAETLFPEDPTFHVVHGLERALADDMPAALAQLEQASGALGEAQTKAARDFLEMFHQLPQLAQVMEGLMVDDRNVSLWSVVRQTSGFLMRARTAQSGSTDDLYLPLPPVLLKSVRKVAATEILGLAMGKRDRIIEQLAEVAQIHPDGFLHLTRGVFLFSRGDVLALARSEQAFVQAAQSPSLFTIQTPAWFGAAAAACVLGREGPTSERAAARVRAARYLRQVVAGGVRPQYGYLMSTMAIELQDWPLAHWIVGEWQRQAPKDPRLAEQQVVLAFRSGNYAQAIELIDRLLRRDTSQATRWKNLRHDALTRLQSRLEHLRRAAASGSP